ncbi:hypothetical protein [Microvirga zambiensis]|uniref:hypothetical protein n=1 Tax=Microvirga zambiensis TaxID=1402137 RepID=UPI00191E2A24|nr:hypothetical protein [Microvirga zambiensis]
MSHDQSFFVVWNPFAGPPTFRHPTYDDARREAVRLAGLNRGQEFIVLEARAIAKLREPVEVRELRDAEEYIPF